MDLIVALIAIEIVASKFLVTFILSYRPEKLYEERNPLLRLFLNRFYIQHDVWLSFFCTIALVVLSIYLLNSYFGGVLNHILFLSAGTFITILNLGTAHSTYFRRTNFITRRILK